MKHLAIALLFILCIGKDCYCLDIPLDNVVVNGKKSSNENIAYVDIEKLFNEHPMCIRLSSEFQTEVDKRKNEIKELERAIDELNKIIISTTTEIDNAKAQLQILVVTSSSIAQMKTDLTAITTNTQNSQLLGPIESTSTVQTTNTNNLIIAKENEIKEKVASIETLRNEIAKKNIELAEKIKQDKDELCRLEEKHSASVMSDLYKIFDKIAMEKNLTIILDKNNILYGQNVENITDEVKKRFQGR